MNEARLTYPEERSTQGSNMEGYTLVSMNACKHLFETKFPLVSGLRNDTQVMENEIISQNNGIYEILYLPFDKTRKDKREQVSIKNKMQRIAVTIKSDKDNPEITFQLFESTDDQHEKTIVSEVNSPEAVYRTMKILGELSGLDNFMLTHK